MFSKTASERSEIISAHSLNILQQLSPGPARLKKMHLHCLF